MNIQEAIRIHGADAVFTAASAGACEDYEPLRAMGLHIGSIDEAEQISLDDNQSNECQHNFYRNSQRQ